MPQVAVPLVGALRRADPVPPGRWCRRRRFRLMPHDRQRPVQAVMQQVPCAQNPGVAVAVRRAAGADRLLAAAAVHAGRCRSRSRRRSCRWSCTDHWRAQVNGAHDWRGRGQRRCRGRRSVRRTSATSPCIPPAGRRPRRRTSRTRPRRRRSRRCRRSRRPGPGSRCADRCPTSAGMQLPMWPAAAQVWQARRAVGRAAESVGAEPRQAVARGAAGMTDRAACRSAGCLPQARPPWCPCWSRPCSAASLGRRRHSACR